MKPVRIVCSILVGAMILLVSIIPAAAMAFTAEDIYESVFVIYSGNSLGSGFAIGENCIVTNAHVVSDPNRITVRSYQGQEYPAAVLGMDTGKDLAVLGIENAVFRAIPLADLSSMKTGDDIYTIGAPKSMAYTLTKGVISAKERIVGGNSYIQIDAAINEGNSGGPLLNSQGQVLGINTLKLTDSEGIGLSIPVTVLTAYLASLDLEMDERGNVVGKVPFSGLKDPEQENGIPESPETGASENPETDPASSDSLPPITGIALAALGISVIANIILTIALIYQKRKNLTLKYDPKERTDFDIDILE